MKAGNKLRDHKIKNKHTKDQLAFLNNSSLSVELFSSLFYVFH